MGEIARVENHWRGDKVSFIGLTVFVEGALEGGNCNSAVGAAGGNID